MEDGWVSLILHTYKEEPTLGGFITLRLLPGLFACGFVFPDEGIAARLTLTSPMHADAIHTPVLAAGLIPIPGTECQFTIVLADDRLDPACCLVRQGQLHLLRHDRPSAPLAVERSDLQQIRAPWRHAENTLRFVRRLTETVCYAT